MNKKKSLWNVESKGPSWLVGNVWMLIHNHKHRQILQHEGPILCPPI